MTKNAASVLVADPSADNRDSLALLLGLSGLRVRTAANAAQVLSEFAAEVPDVAVLEAAFPDLDGFELAQRLRNSPSPRTLFVLLTGRVLRPDQPGRAAFDFHLVKPADPKQLLTLLGRAAQARA